MRRSLLDLLAFLLTSWLLPVDIARCQTLVPSHLDRIGNSVAVRFDTVPGRAYRIEHSADLANWTLYPDSIYGLGQNVRYHVYDAPAPNTQTVPHPANNPYPAEEFFFMLTAFDDGSAVAAWTGTDGSPAKAYLPSFDLAYQGGIMQEMVRCIVGVAAPGSPYAMRVWSMSSVKPAGVENIPTPQSEQATLARLVSQYAQVRSEMIGAVNWRATHPTPYPQIESLFDDRGQATRQFFRVREYTTDSNFDHVTDDVQFLNSENPFNQDSDGDGIPNGYDTDLWPEAQYPAVNALLSNVLINEVLMSNEFTNADEDGGANDWVELYNPTNAAIDLSGWYLSDSTGSSQRAKWAFPAGTTIGSNQFLVVWVSNKNRLNPAAPLHTSFSFNAGDPDASPPVVPNPVVLSRPNPVGGNAIIVDSFQPNVAAGRAATPNFIGQRTDISFGRYPTATGLQTGYMILPTPGGNGTRGRVGQHNVVGALGFTAPPTFSAASSSPGLYDNQTVTAILEPPASGGAIHFTTNSANPTRYSELYSVPLTANRTVILRAIAAKEGYILSRSITRSYLFKEDALGTAPAGTLPTNYQGARDGNANFLGLLRGYPEQTTAGGYLLLFGMDAATIAAKKAILSQELSAVPVVSLVGTVADIFDLAGGGIYANSSYTNYLPADPRQREWQRLCSFEFVEANKSAFVQGNACLTITGGSSIDTFITRKHNLRVEFSSVHGDKKLVYPLFPDFAWNEFNTIHLKNPTHESWSNTYGLTGSLNGDDYTISQSATYCNDAWMRAAHTAMGYEAPRWRWVHLFINGLYWGPHQLTERVDDEFMDAHFGAAEYDVIKQGGPPSYADSIDGNVSAWTTLVAACQAVKNAADADKPARYAEVEAAMDMNNYIDYLICNTFASNDDWCGNNWRAARSHVPGQKWKFLIWDAEWSFRPGEQQPGLGGDQSPDPARFFLCTGPPQLHAGLQDYAPYRQRFSDRIKKHFFYDPIDPTTGTLASDRAAALFQDQMAKFEQVLFSESARWGNMDAAQSGRTAPMTKADPTYLPGKPYGDWDRNTAYTVNTWMPQRRTYYLNRMQAIGLYQP